MSGPVLAFDLNATRGGRLTRIDTVKVPADKAGDPTIDPLVEARKLKNGPFNENTMLDVAAAGPKLAVASDGGSDAADELPDDGPCAAENVSDHTDAVPASGSAVEPAAGDVSIATDTPDAAGRDEAVPDDTVFDSTTPDDTVADDVIAHDTQNSVRDLSMPAPSPFSEKAVARAELAATYASFLGVDLQRTDLIERLSADNGDDFSAEAISGALSRVGLVSYVTAVNPPQGDIWPALAEMTSGQMVLVLEQQGDTLTVYDATRPNNQADVDVDEFLSVYAGKVIRADVEVTELNRRHANDGPRQHWFWGEISKFRKIMLEVALGSFVANLLAVAVALFSLQVYDRVIPHQSTATLWVLAIGAGLAMLLEAFLRIARARLMDSAGRKIELRIQTMLMDRLLGMQAGRPGQTPSGTFAAVREFSAIREFFTASTIGTLTDLPFIVLFLALVASIGGNVVWVLFAGGILMVLPSFFMQKKMMELTMATQGASTKSSRLLHESIYDLDTIKAQRGEERFRRIWGELSALSSIATSEQRKLSTTLTFWSQGVQQATYVAAVVVGTFMVFQGQFTVGTIIAVGILTSRTLGPLTQLAATLARWANVKAALEALDDIADAPQDVENDRSYLRRENLTGTFELREVVYTYDEEAGDTLNIPALMVSPGQKVAVLGANGSGKSTLLKLMSGLHRPTSGRILIDGVDMGQVMARDLRRGIGYLSQEVRLFAGTLRENLNLTLLERDDDRMLAALDFAGLGPFVRNHPRGLDLEIRDGGEGLSIGQRQSIGWARMWLQNPSICLLDEPTAALDQTLEAALVSRLETWLEGRTAIIATHRVPILALADRTMILQNGRLTVDGPRDDVLQHLQKKKAS